MAEIIKKQKESLVQTIKDAEKSEISRMKRLAQVATTGERSVLLRRYEKERKMDQERIENLSKDFFTLQEKLNTGHLTQLTEQRSTTSRNTQRDSHRIDGQNKNRFVGLEDHNDIIFHTAVCDKFDKYDHKFREKITRPVFDARTEVHKLKLLNDKRTLLKQLVCLHVAETGGGGSAAVRGQSRGEYTGRTGTSGYARSESGYSRESDRASYATFASSSRGMDSDVARRNQAKYNIPKLGIPNVRAQPECR
jgi:hypothetical protein